jgi:hypothetical protein
VFITLTPRRLFQYLGFCLAAYLVGTFVLYLGVLTWAKISPLPPETPTGVIPLTTPDFKGHPGANELGISLDSQQRTDIGGAYVFDINGLYKNEAEGVRLLRAETANNNPFAALRLINHYERCGGNGVPLYKAFSSWWWTLPKRWLPVPQEGVVEAFKTADWLATNWPQFYSTEDARLLRFTYCLWVNRP